MSAENTEFYALNELRELAKESDRLDELVPEIGILDGFFSMMKDTTLKIKACTSVKELKNIEFPQDIKSIIGKKRVKNINTDAAETHRAHVHADKNVHTYEKTTNSEAEKVKSSNGILVEHQNNVQKANICTSESTGFKEKLSPVTMCKKNNQESQLCNVSRPETEVLSGLVKIVPLNSSGLSQGLMETPVMNRTFNKLMNNTVIVDSASPKKSNKKFNIEGNNFRSAFKELQNSESNFRITRSASKELQNSESNLKITRSASKGLQNNESSSSKKQTRSGCKRKSSSSKSHSFKKKKLDTTDSVPKSLTKASKLKQPCTKNAKAGSVLSSANKIKPVITPTMKYSTSMSTHKEKQLLEEIKKKEEKASENRKKVLAARQLKAEASKKKRTEKMEKTIQKRLLIEKEKEERLEKKDIDKKAQNKDSVLKPKHAPIIRSKEIIENNMKENIYVNGFKQYETKEPVFKTPVRKRSSSENYDLTPAPDSSTYDSDDEDKPRGKRIPEWAQHLQLKVILTKQYYNPPNIDEIFGSYIEPPDLSKIFGVQKKCYNKRTSSAVWHSPPIRGFCS